MEDLQNHSSAYSSLANSTNDINSNPHSDKKLVGSTNVLLSPSSSTASRSPTRLDSSLTSTSDARTVKEMRTITDDYNTLLRKATSQIKSLTSEKFDLTEQCEKLLTVNEELAQDLGRMIQKERELKEENKAIVDANNELFEETQRLSDEEARWEEERERFEGQILALREQVSQIERKLEATDKERKVEAEAAIARLRQEQREAGEKHRAEVREIERAKREVEEEANLLATRLHKAETDRDNVQQRKDKIAGENMQLMVEHDEQTKRFKTQKKSLEQQLEQLSQRCQKLEAENARLRSAKVEVDAKVRADKDLDAKFERLTEQNKNLSLWREQLVSKNKLLAEENDRLKEKCTNLEDLLHEEETDINDVLELIKKMQVNSPGGKSPTSAAAAAASAAIGPISKFRDIKF